MYFNLSPRVTINGIISPHIQMLYGTHQELYYLINSILESLIRFIKQLKDILDLQMVAVEHKVDNIC